MNKKKLLIILGSIIGIILVIVFIYIFNLRAVSNSNELVSFTVNSGESKETIVDNLKNANLIRSKYVTLAYIILSGNGNIQAGNYELSRNMSTKEIIESLANGDVVNKNREVVSITFKEGITLKEYLQLIADNTNLEYDVIIEQINDLEFLNNLIEEYWFLTEDILNEDIYYALEGYLYPNTYEFHKETTLDEVISKILNETDNRLSTIREKLEASNNSIHEILTMASIAEKEAISYEDRQKVVQVINTRIDLNMNLGMDVTTYYGVQKDMKEILTNVDINDSNPYNTRVSGFLGLPVGPICNPSIESIEAALNPADTNYIYFFADIVTGNVYFTDNYDEFLNFKNLYG